jgi:hypothetical protein
VEIGVFFVRGTAVGPLGQYVGRTAADGLDLSWRVKLNKEVITSRYLVWPSNFYLLALKVTVFLG